MEQRVCCLKTGLYGLKQSPRAWNEKLHNFLVHWGLKRSIADYCVYTKKLDKIWIILALYVDDGLLCCSNKEIQDKLLKDLQNTFEITVTEPKYFVGLEIERNRVDKTLCIHQQAYLKRLLEKFGMKDCRPVSSSGDPNNKLSKEMQPTTIDERERMGTVPYREAVGSLMFVMTCTRPDISFEVSKVAQYAENPGEQHWTAVKRIMRYLKGSLNVVLNFGSSDKHLTLRQETSTLDAYCDSDWAGDLDKRRSTTGCIFTLNHGAVTWMSRIQRTVALSTTESEYMALTEAVKEIKWLRQLLCDIGIRQEKATLLRTDNQGALLLSKNPEYHRRTKHIDIKYHFVREEQESERIKIIHIESKKQPADMLTKSMSGPALNECRNMVNLFAVGDGC